MGEFVQASEISILTVLWGYGSGRNYPPASTTSSHFERITCALDCVFQNILMKKKQLTTYTYTAYDAAGVLVEGVFAAYGRGEVLAHILAKQLKPVKIEEEASFRESSIKPSPRLRIIWSAPMSSVVASVRQCCTQWLWLPALFSSHSLLLSLWCRASRVFSRKQALSFRLSLGCSLVFQIRLRIVTSST